MPTQRETPDTASTIKTTTAEPATQPTTSEASPIAATTDLTPLTEQFVLPWPVKPGWPKMTAHEELELALPRVDRQAVIVEGGVRQRVAVGAEDAEHAAISRHHFLMGLGSQALGNPDLLNEIVHRQLLPEIHVSQDEFRTRLDALVTQHAPAISNGGQESFVQAGGLRPAYNGVSEKTRELFGSIASMGVYNRAFTLDVTYHDGKSEIIAAHNMRLSWPELQKVAEGAAREMHARTHVVLPFLREPDTAHKNVAYAMDLVGAEKVVGISVHEIDPKTGKLHEECRRSEANVQKVMGGSDAKMFIQGDILAAVDWNLVCEACGIMRDHGAPKDLPPGGSKGRTMLAGLLAMAAREIPADDFVAFHDTDIQNPGEYDCLRYQGVPLHLPIQMDLVAVQLAKTGDGRNNEGWVRTANNAADERSYLELVRKTARLCGTLVWPLTDARMIRMGELQDIPWTTGMSIETQINIHLAALQVLRGERLVAQVCNEAPKRERSNPGDVRESALMHRCELWLRDVLDCCNELKALLPQFDLAQIRQFNVGYGARQIDGFYQSPHHASNTPSSQRIDCMLPSLRQLNELRAIDWDRLRSAAQVEN